jgi:hypothetical protein
VSRLVVFVVIAAVCVVATWGCTPDRRNEARHTPQGTQEPTVVPQVDTPGWKLPKIEIVGVAAEIFTVSGCSWVSGLSCDFQYNGKKPLPSRVVFFEYSEDGEIIGGPTVLVYPRLEVGQATFRLHASPAKIVVHGQGPGPWESPF